MKKHPFYKKAITIVLAVALLFQVIPVESVFAVWTTPNNITINKSNGSTYISYFKNLYNTPQNTNSYNVANQPEDIAYCIDAEAYGPGGTAYALNDSAINATYRAGLTQIAQYGYPTNSWGNWGISASEAQYATQAAMHWWQNAVFGGTIGWVRAGVQNNGCPTNYAGTLGYADWLLSLAGNSTSPLLYAKFTSGFSAWSNAATPTSTFNVGAYDSDYWVLTLPAGVTIAGSNTFTGTGNASITVNLTDPAAFASSTKHITVQGYSNRTEGQIHYYVAGGYQNMIVYQQSVSAAGDPDDNILPDATGDLSIHKVTQLHSGAQNPEAGAVFQVYSVSTGALVAVITTSAAGSAEALNLPVGSYNVHQSYAPPGTILAPDQLVPITGGVVSYGAFVNNSTYFPITKYDADNGALVAGATITISQSGVPIVSAVTGADGNAWFESLPAGQYSWQESAAPAGYLLDTNTYIFTLNADGSVSGTTAFTDVKSNGYIEVYKTTDRLGVPALEPGAVFEIYLTSSGSYSAAPAAVRDQITTDANGHVISKLLPYGNYTMRQITAPAGTILNPTVWQFDVGTNGAGTMVATDTDTVNVSNTSTVGRLEIVKTTNRGYSAPEAGAIFQVYNSSYASYAAAPATEKDILTTDAAGYDVSNWLPYGTYTVHQTFAPDGTKAMADFSVTLGNTNNETIHRDLVNQTYWGQAEINKTTNFAGNVKLEAGATFQIFNQAYASYAAAPTAEKDTITTDANGHAISKLLPLGTYTASQTVTPSGAQINAGTWTFILGMDGATYVENDVDTQNIVNLPTFGQLDLSKTTNRGFSVDEAGATFEIYCNEYPSFAAAPSEYKDTITTDINGDAVTKLLPYGDYIVHQSVMPAGTKAVADYTVSLKIAQGSVVHQDLVNETYWGDIQILKYKSAPSDTSGILNPEPGATFRIFPSEYVTYAAAVAALSPAQEQALTDEITSGIAGVATTNHQLPYGTYTVEQIDTAANLLTFKVDAWMVTIGAVDNQTYTYIRNNEIYEQYLSVIKTDAETGQVIKLAGATFQILASDGVTVLSDKNGDTLFVTDTNGRIDIKDLPLQVGSYFIRETVAPKGYVLNPDVKAFAVSITDHGSSIVTIDYGVDIRGELFADTAQTCQLIVDKQGDVLTAATQMPALNADTGAQYTDNDGKKLSLYDFTYSLTGKVGAVFEVFVGAKDIGDSDGLLKKFDKDGDSVKETSLTAGTSLGLITTAAVTLKDGTIKYIASLDGLPLDAVTGTAQYVVKEVTAPTGDLINHDPLIFDFTFADQTITQIDQEQSVTDDRQRVQISLEKEKEAGTWNTTTQSFDWPVVPAQGILFGLYAAQDIMAEDGSILVAKDTLVDVLYTNTSGVGKTTKDLPMSSYYAKELNVTPDVVFDGTTTYPITCTPTGQITPTAIFKLNDGNAIFNRQIAGTMEIYKITADTQLPMVGVVFEVYDKSANLVDTVTTDSTGHAKTKVMPYGNYTLIETRSTTGYALHDKQSFSIYVAPGKGKYISEAEMTVEDQKMAQIEVYKVTADGTATPMNGVIFGVYDVKTNVEVARITTDSKGYGSLYAMPGDYYLKEIKTWDGYALSPEKIPVDAEFAHLYTFRATNTLTELRVEKQSTTGGAPLAGMEFSITDKVSGKLITLEFDAATNEFVAIHVLGAIKGSTPIESTIVTTGADGSALVTGLTAGTYVITETKAPAGYNLDSKPTEVTITTSSAGVLSASVLVKDSQITVKTGESGNDNLIVIGICLLTGAGLLLVILDDIRSRKRRNS